MLSPLLNDEKELFNLLTEQASLIQPRRVR